MKPSWDDAPYWAEWLAMDGMGEWFWFESMPRPHESGVWESYERVQEAGRPVREFALSLERRP